MRALARPLVGEEAHRASVDCSPESFMMMMMLWKGCRRYLSIDVWEKMLFVEDVRFCRQVK